MISNGKTTATTQPQDAEGNAHLSVAAPPIRRSLMWYAPGVLLGLFILAFAAVLWIAHQNADKTRRDEHVNATESAGETIRMRLKGNENYLLMLAKERADGAMDAKSFQERASRYVADHPEMINITWVDANFTVHDVAPLEPNRQILGLSLELPEPKRASHLAAKSRLPVYTIPFEAIQGKPSYEIWVPVFDNSTFLGLFAGVYSCERTLQALIPSQTLRSSHVSFVNASGAHVCDLPPTGTVDNQMVHQVPLTPQESGMQLRFEGYGLGTTGWVLRLLELLCLALALGIAYTMWGLRREADMRKRTEQELRGAHEYLQQLVSSANVMIVGLDARGHLQMFNKAAERITGYSLKELEGIDWFERIVPKDRYTHVWKVFESFQKKTGAMPAVFENPILTKTGEERIISWQNSVIPAFDGSNSTISFGVDITASHRAKQALGASEERFSTAFRFSPVAMAVFRPSNGQIVDVNDAFVQTTGYAREEIVGHTTQDLQLYAEPKDRERLRRILQEEGALDNIEYRLRRKSGDIIVVSNSARAIELGGERHYLSLIQDITTRKLAESQLAQSEARLRALGDKGSIGITLFDSHLRVIYYSKSCERITGYSEEEITKLSVAAWAHPDECEMVERQMATLLANPGTAASIEARFRRKDGEWIWVESISQNLLDDPVVRAIVTSFWDITDRKRTQDELRNREAELREAQRVGRLGSWDWDADTDTITWSREYYRIYGFDPAQRPPGYEEHLKAYTPESAARLAAAVKRNLETGEPYEVDLELAHPNGPCQWITARSETKRDSTGRIIGLRGTAQDITERRRTEAALRASEAKMRSIVDNAGLGVALISPEMEVLELNQRMREWFPNVDPAQRPICYQVFNEPARERVCDYCPTAKTLQDGMVHEALTQTPTPAGLRNFRVVSSPLLDEGGKVTSVIELVEDITQRMSLESQFRQAQKMESIGRLAGRVAHDFNNMLGAIIGHTELLLENPELTQPIVAELQEIREAAERSASLTRQLLAFARKQIVSPVVLDLNETVEGMLSMLRRLIGEDIDLVWMPESAPLQVNMDPSQIDQILANLCVNARDAITGVGKITIATHAADFDEAFCEDHPGFSAGAHVQLDVSDDGCGMDTYVLSKIFEPFFTTKEMGKGTGLGLATVYGIVKQNKGFIDVYSEPGKGTTFKVYLPRHTSKTEQVRKEVPKARAAGGRETILLVEDERIILDLAKRVLEIYGYEVLVASTPGEAMQVAREHVGKVHLLLTDVVMPEMNGRDLSQALSEEHPGLKCLFMSGYTADVIAHHGALNEGVDFIQKPFSVNALASKVRATLDRR
ncbi:MAG: PAS domain S-box protein [candidate division Zixibacteria bacterium]|nr:PAS domain S-box protein [candidate division Zixibacteria bacterium]